MWAPPDVEMASFLETMDQEELLTEQRQRSSSWPRRSSRVAGLLAVSAALLVSAAAVVWSSSSSGPSAAADSANADGVFEVIQAVEKKRKSSSLLKRGLMNPSNTSKAEAADEKAAKAAQAAQEAAEAKAEAADEKAAKAAQAAQEAAEAKAMATLNRAEAKYSGAVVEAFAALAKLSYCGPLPGISGAIVASCSSVALPNSTTSCERAGFGVVPGSVRVLSAADMDVMDSLFGYVAKVEPTMKNSTMKPGVLVAIRGSVDNGANIVRDKQTRMSEESLEGCEGCSVHQGYHRSYNALAWELNLYLNENLCFPGEDCTVYVTGHGSGAAIATMFAWELGYRNFTVGPSYLFESPQVGNDAFAEQLTAKFSGDGKDGPVFSITTGKDSVPRWPFNMTFKSWGIEAHYPDKEAKEREPLCFAGKEDCGVKKIPKDDLTSKDTCLSALAPFGSFCTFHAFVPQCYGGVGYQTVALMPDMPGAKLEQPKNLAAATWHPSSKDGEQVKALNVSTEARDWYSLKTLKAFSALTKLAYCGNSYGLANAVQSTCSGRTGLCSVAGFGIVPASVKAVGVDYQSQLTQPYYMKDTLFFYTALIRRTGAEFAKKPFFMPAEACVLVFRGSNNNQNMAMNRQTRQIPLNDTECGECTANEGILNAWKDGLEKKVLSALKKSGCEANPQKETVDKVFIVGHSMGGTMATLALYMLHKLKFDVQLSWAIEGGRPGNPTLMDYINNAMVADKRPVPFWQVTHSNDKIPRTPASTVVKKSGVGRDRFQLHFNSSDVEKVSMCTSIRDMSPDSHCGIYEFPRDDLEGKLPSNSHCKLPFAPAGQMCMLPGFAMGSPYAMAMQCTWGGSI